jgi:hypothetical protein
MRFHKRGHIKRAAALFSMSILALSVAIIGQGLFSLTDADAAGECVGLAVTNVTANGNDGNVPSNTIDNNLSTRWSNNGIGSWIQFDLGQKKMVCSLDIAWYKGDTRTNNFVISVSADGSSFTNVYSGKNSGTTLSQERVDFADREARYVKITVNGNSDNSWASITETDISGYNLDSTTPTPTPTPTPTTTTGNDKFGVKMIYPTRSGGEQWFLSSPTGDSRFDPKTTVSKNSDGSYKVTSTKVRMNVFTSTGYDSNEIDTYNQKQLATQGYMQAQNDWKNVEITGYIKFNSGSEDNFAWYARGGRHSDVECEGTAYKGDLYYSGKTRFAKEQWHSGGYSFTSTKQAMDSLKGKWVGFKFVMYNFVKDGKTMVKLENWVDKTNSNNWVKVDERIDSGGWGSEGDTCGGSPDQIISWGGPIATFRWDSATNVDFKNLSVREIQAS